MHFDSLKEERNNISLPLTVISIFSIFRDGGYEKAMKETAKELDVMISEWLEEHRQKRALGEGVDGAQDFMNVMLSSLDGKTIDGIDADTLIKSTVLVCIRDFILFIYLLPFLVIGTIGLY